jgi:archaellum component FlaC
MSQTQKLLGEKSATEIYIEVEELKKRVKTLEASVNMLKLKMGRKWV